MKSREVTRQSKNWLSCQPVVSEQSIIKRAYVFNIWKLYTSTYIHTYIQALCRIWHIYKDSVLGELYEFALILLVTCNIIILRCRSKIIALSLKRRDGRGLKLTRIVFYFGFTSTFITTNFGKWKFKMTKVSSARWIRDKWFKFHLNHFILVSFRCQAMYIGHLTQKEI